MMVHIFTAVDCRRVVVSAWIRNDSNFQKKGKQMPNESTLLNISHT